MVSDSWLGLFPFSRVRILPPSQSDHAPLLVEVRTLPASPLTPKRRRFRFESFWLEHEDCAGVIDASWSTEVVGLPMYQLVTKVEHTRLALQNWQRHTFGQRQ